MTRRPVVRIVRFGATRPWSRPGSSVAVELILETRAPVVVDVQVDLLDLDAVVGSRSARYRLPAGRSVRPVRLTLPAAPRHGYGLRASLRWAGGRATADAAVEALAGWWESPRHAALTDFASPGLAARRIAGLRDWHVTVVQHYDWMYRHYRYLPPAGEEFVDPLGRRVSHRVVRELIREARAAGIASLAYGAVYGAEREYVDEHPDEQVFDTDGRPLSLGDVFYINDLRPGSRWRGRLLREYETACRRLGFDGIHMDTYGPPHRGVGADGAAIAFADLYPDLIAEAAARVHAARAGARVLFNCVDGFPLEAVAGAPACALYLELWPPAVAWRDVVCWIDRARSVATGRQVIVAAYISAVRAAAGDRVARGRSLEAAVLLTSVIAAAGGYHHVIAEDDRLLVEGYYPEARRLRRREAAELRSAWAFSARYVHLLSDPGSVPVEIDEMEVWDSDGRTVPISAVPVAGHLWARATSTSRTRVIQLVDLTSQRSDRWDEPHEPSPTRRGWTVRLPGSRRPVAASPWSRAGAAVPARAASGPGEWRLPAFRRWVLIAG